MTAASSPATWVRRLTQASERLDEVRPRLDRVLTQADPETAERWSGAQVLAHIIELLEYWPAEAERIVAAGGAPVRFGRSKADEGRLAAVAQADGVPAAGLVDEARARIATVVAWLERYPQEHLLVVGQHFRRGPMPVADLIEEYVVAHTEEHVAQLDRALADDKDGRR